MNFQPDRSGPVAQRWRLDLEPRTDEALKGLAAEMARPKLDLIETILNEWLVTNAYLPVPYALDEENPAEGNA
ncbi:hypothetical protein LJR234_005908 [Mesorhizobium amorphae]|jgi:hypothetical protein|uniref:hypothetical protein n=1 Tax=Mesorhizobium amorphae TaxID=71433 RepID=UPI003ECD97E5